MIGICFTPGGGGGGGGGGEGWGGGGRAAGGGHAFTRAQRIGRDT